MLSNPSSLRKFSVFLCDSCRCQVVLSVTYCKFLSLGLIHNMPTLCVWPLFGIFYKFCSDVQTCHHIRGCRNKKKHGVSNMPYVAKALSQRHTHDTVWVPRRLVNDLQRNTVSFDTLLEGWGKGMS